MKHPQDGECAPADLVHRHPSGLRPGEVFHVKHPPHLFHVKHFQDRVGRYPPNPLPGIRAGSAAARVFHVKHPPRRRAGKNAPHALKGDGGCFT